jgi:hypothetical protein
MKTEEPALVIVDCAKNLEAVKKLKVCLIENWIINTWPNKNEDVFTKQSKDFLTFLLDEYAEYYIRMIKEAVNKLKEDSNVIKEN